MVARVMQVQWSQNKTNCGDVKVANDVVASNQNRRYKVSMCNCRSVDYIVLHEVWKQ